MWVPRYLSGKACNYPHGGFTSVAYKTVTSSTDIFSACLLVAAIEFFDIG